MDDMEVYQTDPLALRIEKQIPTQRFAAAALVSVIWLSLFGVFEFIGEATGVMDAVRSEILIGFAASIFVIPLAIGLRRSSVLANLILIIVFLVSWVMMGINAWQWKDTWALLFPYFTPDTWRSVAIVVIFWTTLQLWATVIFVRSIIALLGKDRELVAGIPAKLSWDQVLRYFGLPRHLWSISRLRAALIILSTSVSAGYLWMLIGYLNTAMVTPRVLLVQGLNSPNCGHLQATDRLKCAAQVMAGFDTFLVSGVIVQFFIIFLGVNIFDFAARRLSRIRFNVVIDHIRERPVLYLRPFSIDQTGIPSGYRTLSAYFFNLGRILSRSIESTIVEELEVFGPVIAVGDKGKKYVPHGALRDFFENDWQDAVIAQIEKSGLIVLVFEDREAIWWELERIASLGQTNHLVIIFSSPADTTAIELVAETLGVSRPVMDDTLRQSIICWRPGPHHRLALAPQLDVLHLTAGLRLVTQDIA